MRNMAATGPDELSILIVKRYFRELKTFFQLGIQCVSKAGNFFLSVEAHQSASPMRKPGKKIDMIQPGLTGP